MVMIWPAYEGSVMHLEIPLERGVEADLAERLTSRRARGSLENSTVFEDEKSGRARTLRRAVQQTLTHFAHIYFLPQSDSIKNVFAMAKTQELKYAAYLAGLSVPP